MKRHPSLEPFSRDHNVALSIAQRLQNTPGPDSARAFMHAWQVEMQDHFDEEERLLGPLLKPELLATLLAEHADIRMAAAQLKAELSETEQQKLGALLETHIRWEERTLFPEIERTASQEQLQVLALESSNMDDKHAKSGLAPHRAELIARRRRTTAES